VEVEIEKLKRGTAMKLKIAISNLAIVALLSATALTTPLFANSSAGQSDKNGKRGKIEQVSADVGNAAKDTAKDTASTGEKTGNAVVKGVEDPAKATADAAKAGAKGTSKAIRKTGKATAKAGKKTVKAFKK